VKIGSLKNEKSKNKERENGGAKIGKCENRVAQQSKKKRNALNF
jgi:hypothetical protein